MFSETKIAEVTAYLQECPETAQVFIGCDSSRYRNRQGLWYASYSSVVVIHARDPDTGRGTGCRVYVETEQMQDYDQQKNRPFMRMMQEAYKATELYEQLEEALLEFDVEIHLDINKDARHGSNVAHNAAVGYVLGMTGRDVKTKPDAWAASHVADHGVRGKFKRATVH